MSYQYRKNVYTCDVGHETVTVDRDAGVTPFLITCPECNGRRVEGRRSMAASALYRVPQGLTPTHEWYSPDEAERATLDAYRREHVNKGGLLLRPIKGAGK